MFLSRIIQKYTLNTQFMARNLWFWGGLLVAGTVLTNCRNKTDASDMSGEELAKLHCGSCHAFPEPKLLPKAIWEKGVLPKMALRLGFLTDTLSVMNYNAQMEEQQAGAQLGAYPIEPVLAQADWLKIIDYYTTNAPATPVPQAKKAAIQPEMPLFAVREPSPRIVPLTTLVRYDAVHRQIIVGDRMNYAQFVSPALAVTDSVRLSSTPADVLVNNAKGYDWLLMGHMDPDNQAIGKIAATPARAGQPETQVIPQLRRPVQMVSQDFDKDGQPDYIVCQFGHLAGKLSAYMKTATGYREEVIDPVPGARQTIIRDIDKDGWPDVIALLAQGDEQVAWYKNYKGKFIKQTLVRFPPVYGSSSIELADIDRDGDEDLIYTNGDNADYSYSLKAYHGVRIYLNDGKFSFTESWFYPLHGATQVVARDFDQDGDMDLAAIAFFPDYDGQNPESFVYFENNGRQVFTPRTFPQANQGRWLVMEAADYDQDGDDDLLLGSFHFSVTKTPERYKMQWRQQSNGLVVLENKRK